MREKEKREKERREKKREKLWFFGREGNGSGPERQIEAGFHSGIFMRRAIS